MTNMPEDYRNNPLWLRAPEEYRAQQQRIRAQQMLERIFGSLAEYFEECRQRVAVCPDALAVKFNVAQSTRR